MYSSLNPIYFSLYRITNDPIVMARHLMWIEVNLIKNLCQDELINQLICSDGISDSGETENFPNWRLNCSFFNTLTSSAQNSVLIVSNQSYGQGLVVIERGTDVIVDMINVSFMMLAMATVHTVNIAIFNCLAFSFISTGDMQGFPMINTTISVFKEF